MWLYYGVLGAVVLAVKQDRWQFREMWEGLTQQVSTKLVGAGLALAVLLASIAALQMPDDRLHVHILDVGQGDAIFIQCPNGQQLLVDGGSDPSEVTPGNAPDGHQMPKLVEQDLEQGVPVRIVAADRGYDDTRNHYFLEVRGIESAICLKDNRTKKKDPNKAGWIAMKQKAEHLRGQKDGPKIERKSGEAKQSRGLGRCRYVGLLRYRIQVYVTALPLNLETMAKLGTVVNSKAGRGLTRGTQGGVRQTREEGRAPDPRWQPRKLRDYRANARASAPNQPGRIALAPPVKPAR